MVPIEEALEIAFDWDEGPEIASNPFIVLTAFHSTRKIQSEEHRTAILRLIEERCRPFADAEHSYQLDRLEEYVTTAPIEPARTGLLFIPT